MSLVSGHAPLSALIGAAQVVDAGVLLRNKGRITKAVMAFSFLEYAWAVVSAVQATSGKGDTPTWLPLSFVAWIIIGALTGLWITMTNRNPDALPRIPAWSVIGGGVFGVFFLAASLWLVMID